MSSRWCLLLLTVILTSLPAIIEAETCPRPVITAYLKVETHAIINAENEVEVVSRNSSYTRSVLVDFCCKGYVGADCLEVCPENYYGINCLEECKCENNATCSNTDGACTCLRGFEGFNCSTAYNYTDQIQIYYGTLVVKLFATNDGNRLDFIYSRNTAYGFVPPRSHVCYVGEVDGDMIEQQSEPLECYPQCPEQIRGSCLYGFLWAPESLQGVAIEFYNHFDEVVERYNVPYELMVKGYYYKEYALSHAEITTEDWNWTHEGTVTPMTFPATSPVILGSSTFLPPIDVIVTKYTLQLIGVVLAVVAVIVICFLICCNLPPDKPRSRITPQAIMPDNLKEKAIMPDNPTTMTEYTYVIPGKSVANQNSEFQFPLKPAV